MGDIGSSEIYIKKDVVPIKAIPLKDSPVSHSPLKPQESFASASTIEPNPAPPKESLLNRLGLKKKSKKPPQKQESYFAQLTSHHGRALVDTRVNNQVVWGGEYPADIYGSRDFKGAIMNNISIGKEEYSPYGYRVNGLKDNVGLERIKIVSDFLRSRGLPTELPVKTSQLEELVDGLGKKIPIDEWKGQTLEAIFQNAKTHRNLGNHDLADNEEREYQKIKKYFDSTNFYIVERSLQTAVRLRDLTEAKNENELRKLVEPGMRWLNTVTDTLKRGLILNTPKPERFEFTPNNIQEYFGEWLPTQIGIYLARLHKLEIAHGFPHAQNWSLVGTLYDLDSVHGKLLEDGSPTEGEYVNDTRVTGGAIYEITGVYGFLAKEYPNLEFKALAAYATSYINERFGIINNPSKLEEIRQKYFTELECRGHKLDIPAESWNKIVQILLPQMKQPADGE